MRRLVPVCSHTLKERGDTLWQITTLVILFAFTQILLTVCNRFL